MSTRRLAIIGARGIHNYGGFETLVGELAPKLRERGYEIYCSVRRDDSPGSASEYKGVKLEYFPFRFPRSNRLGRVFEVLYDWYFEVKFSFFSKVDFVYCLGIPAGILSPFCRLSGARIIINIDGLEWKREKFSFLERAYIRLAYLVSYIGATYLILDNSQLIGHVPSSIRWKAIFIPYGVAPIECVKLDDSVIGKYVEQASLKVRPHDYWLVVARLEPDNKIHTIVEAYAKSSTRKPLIIVGGFSSTSYAESVKNLLAHVGDGKSVILLGPVFDKGDLETLRCNCAAYLHGHSVGGTNPSLLEAMSSGNLIVAHRNQFNEEVAAENAFYFDGSEDLARTMDFLDANPDKRSEYGSSARARAREKYRWDEVVATYDKLFQQAESSPSLRAGIRRS